MLSRIALIVTCVGIACAAPSAGPKMRLVWRYQDFEDGPRVAMDVYKSDMSAQLIKDQTCTEVSTTNDYTINKDNFATDHITMHVEPDKGFGGEIKLAGQTYSMFGPDYCYRVYNDKSVFIDCTIPLSASQATQTFPVDNTLDCFLAGHSNATLPLNQSPIGGFLDGSKLAHTDDQNKDAPVQPRNADPEPIVGCLPFPYSDTTLIGNGDPHQNALDVQLSEPITCSQSAGCSVGETASISYNIGFSATATLTKWISGGFSVTQTTTTGNSYTCNGAAKDTVCIWKNVAHTAYTVHNFFSNGCGLVHQSDPIVVKSPNVNNAGGGYYCVVGTCRTQGERYWDNSGP